MLLFLLVASLIAAWLVVAVLLAVGVGRTVAIARELEGRRPERPSPASPSRPGHSRTVAATASVARSR